MKMSMAVVTGTRAEFGQMLPLLEQMNTDTDIHLHLIVTGMHLSREHGETIKEIADSSIKVAHVIDILQNGDLPSDVCNSIAVGLGGFSALYLKHPFDAVLVMGDRYELLAPCIAAMIHQIPIVHVHGGEVTQGAMDDGIRHSITKMASIHFPSIEAYRRRIIQMGEAPERVFAVGALAVDNIMKIQLMSVEELTKDTGVDFRKRTALVTYHPVTREDYSTSGQQMRMLLDSLCCFDLNVIITMPNSDTGYQGIVEIINDFVQRLPHKFVLIKNLGQKRYLSAMKHSAIMVGNTSSGILESASFGIPVINIGDRQTGRIKPLNVVDCECTTEKITQAIGRGLSDDFLRKIEHLENPYGDGNTAERIMRILKTLDFSDKGKLLKKSFHDIS